MNQQELEKAIRTVSSDTSLDPRRKAYLIQNLMTSRWIVAQQQKVPSPGLAEEGGQVAGQCASYHDEPGGILGCEHYKRNCKLKAACCGQLVTCRFCHDKVSDHTMNRHATEEMMCMKCLEVQPVAQNCVTPTCDNASMAKYFCAICKFFDNDDRSIYHCPFCNLCRVGRGLGLDYFHCMTCNACMSITLSSHKCREKGLESDCPICHDFLFTSSTPVKALPCGHFMHSACFQAYTCTHYTCPICSKSLGDMGVYFGMLDALLASEQLPEEFRDRQQDILCNDCEKKGKAPFHWLYHKCTPCGSYNTRAI